MEAPARLRTSRSKLMASVTSEEFAKWLPAIEAHANRMSRVHYLAEFDDLVQEASEAVWLKLEVGYMITNDIMLNAMRNWISYVTHGGRVEASVQV